MKDIYTILLKVFKETSKKKKKAKEYILKYNVIKKGSIGLFKRYLAIQLHWIGTLSPYRDSLLEPKKRPKKIPPTWFGLDTLLGQDLDTQPSTAHWALFFLLCRSIWASYSVHKEITVKKDKTQTTVQNNNISLLMKG